MPRAACWSRATAIPGVYIVMDIDRHLFLATPQGPIPLPEDLSGLITDFQIAEETRRGRHERVEVQ